MRKYPVGYGSFKSVETGEKLLSRNFIPVIHPNIFFLIPG
jgi:hypothetical protein